MTHLLKKAFDEAAQHPRDLQDAIAAIVLAELAAQQRWDDTLARSQPPVHARIFSQGFLRAAPRHRAQPVLTRSMSRACSPSAFSDGASSNSKMWWRLGRAAGRTAEGRFESWKKAVS